PVAGYEMHLGITEGEDCARAFVDLGGRADGAVSANGRVMGCYLHGLFASDDFRNALLASMAPRAGAALSFDDEVAAALETLADHLEAHLDVDRLWRIALRQE
ncbi:MAG: cobyric acid synthase CobQ, partial [Gammaproteobacteria bacterium]|nr:cobyric acid synthase CobQ [Gammaproteobacteria bacterium]